MKTSHIAIRAPSDLKKDINEYVKRKGVTLTQITLDYYRTLLEAENKQEAEQV